MKVSELVNEVNQEQELLELTRARERLIDAGASSSWMPPTSLHGRSRNRPKPAKSSHSTHSGCGPNTWRLPRMWWWGCLTTRQTETSPSRRFSRFGHTSSRGPTR